jgi:O-acetylserine/cysteine efflux transporter
MAPAVSASLPSRLGARDLLIAAMMNILWGLNIVAVKMGVEATAPFTAALLRQAIVFMVCASSLRIVLGRMRDLLLLGLLSGAVFYMFVHASLAVSTNISALAIAGQVGVPFSMILAVIFLGERVHYTRIIGMALAFSGVVLLVFDPAAGREIPGMLLTAAGSFIWAVSSLIQRRLRGVPVLTIYAWIGLIGALVLAPLAWLLEPHAIRALPALPLGSFGWIAFSAIGSTIGGHGAMAWLLQRHPVSSVVPLTLAAPVISVIVASLFFATPLTPLMIVGGIIALVGVAIVTIRTARVQEGESKPA